VPLRPLALATGLVCLSAAQAENECGPATSGGSIVCDVNTYVPTDGRIVYTGLDGLSLSATGLGLVAPALNNRHGIFVGTGSGAAGAASTGTIRIRLEDGSIVTGNALNIGSTIANTEGRYGDGLRSESYGTGDTVVSVGGTITTYGYNAHGAYAWQRQAQASAPVHVQADMDGGSIATHGAFSHGLHARNEAGQGSTEVHLQAGDIRTFGNDSFGLYAHNFDTLPGGLGTALAQVRGGTVSTSGLRSAAVVVRNRLVGSATASVTGAQVQTSGLRAAGILAQAEQGDAFVHFSDASLQTAGDQANGIQAQATGGNAHVFSAGTIETTGTNAVGIWAEASGSVNIDHRGNLAAAGTALVVVAGSGPAAIDNSGQMASLAGHGIDASGASQGTTIVNRGHIRANAPGAYAVLGSHANDQLALLSGSIDGAVSLGAGNDTFTASGGTLAGPVDMGPGDDVLILRGSVELGQANRLDGGGGNDQLIIDGLRLQAFTGESDRPANGSNLRGWQHIEVAGGGTLQLTGDLFDSGGTARLGIRSGSQLDLRGSAPAGFTIHGSLDNAGAVTLSNGVANDRTTITGDYRGSAGSVLALDAEFGGDDSASDLLVVQGDVYGQSTLTIRQVAGAGAQTTNGIRLVQVDGASGGDSFVWDIGQLQVGNYQYVLRQGSDLDPNDWYLVSAVTPCGRCTEDSPSAAQPGPQPAAPLWRPAISTYSVVRSMNADVGFMQTATLHQRRGSAHAHSDNEARAWGRFLAQELRAHGRDRFSYEHEVQGFQLGHDLGSGTDESGIGQRTGWLGHYVSGTAQAWDRLRLRADLEIDTGRIQARSVGAGGYVTHSWPDGGYTDWVLHLSRIDNRFQDSLGDRSQQTGWQLALSQELGTPLWQQGPWSIEGQGQWVLLHTRYASFDDALSHVPVASFQALRGRLGLRIAHARSENGLDMAGRARGLVLQATAHLVHDLFRTRNMTLAARQSERRDRVGETFDQTHVELGLGATWLLSAETRLWTDARYELGLRNRKNTGKLSMGMSTHF